jgi:hypothetical protein
MTSRIKIIVLIAVIVSGIGILIGVRSKKPETEMSGMPGMNMQVQANQSDGLSSEEYSKDRDEFIALVDSQDPKAALSQLRQRTETDNALLRSCHSIAHEIGHEAFEKYTSFGEAMKYQDEICNSGYLHGIIESYFSASKDIFSSMKTVCAGYPLGSYISWECYHGIGHGLMYYTLNDLPRSIELCDSYSNAFARAQCSNGVFMENFNTDQKIHPSTFLKNDDLFYPCRDQKEDHKGDCYFYAPTHYLSLHKNAYEAALTWCAGAETAFIPSCISGVGSQAIKENINNPKYVESVCMNSPTSQRANCITGMIGLYINHFGSLEPAKALCPQLESKNQKACQDTIQFSSSLFAS